MTGDAVDDSFVVVATFWGLVEAKMATELLAGEGIAARLADDGIVSIHPLLANAVGGVRVLVARNDAEAAADLLRLRGLMPGTEQPLVDAGSLEDEALEAEPADESVSQFLGAQKRRR